MFKSKYCYVLWTVSMCTTSLHSKFFDTSCHPGTVPIHPPSYIVELRARGGPMNRLRLRNNRLKFKTSGALPIISEESIEYTSHEYVRRTGRCQHVTGWI